MIVRLPTIRNLDWHKMDVDARLFRCAHGRLTDAKVI